MEIKNMEERKKDILALLLLIVFAFVVNRGIEIKGLFMDDLYLWSCYGEQSFFQYVFPLGSTRFRFLYYLAAWLELALIGPHVGWIVPINILLNGAVAFTIYKMARSFSRSGYVGIFCGIAYLMSRMAYYQIGQTYGLMETMALWMAIGILYLLCDYLKDHSNRGKHEFLAASVLYFSVCFVHERYMVLIPLFFLALLFHRCKDLKLWLAPTVAFALVQGIRAAAIGRLMPAGTGHTQVADTFVPKEAVRYALSQVAYIFGINAGPDYLNGQNYRQAPLPITLLIATADLMLAALVIAFLVKLIREWKHCKNCLPTTILFIGFIGGCIACSSVTIRVEMRWVYVSYAAALLFMSWMYGVLTRDLDRKLALHVRALPYAVMITVYVVLMLQVELYYRGLYPNIYFWPEQQQYNSLAEVTYGTYGDDIFGKTIYVVGDTYGVSDFNAETFFKIFDPERKAEGTKLVHIDDVREIGLVDDSMLVLQEDPEHNRYLDITSAVRLLKCRGIYGYYTDGWLDERAEVQVMTGADGEINMNFYYPGELTGDEWMTIYVNDDPKEYMQFTDQQMSYTWKSQPYRTVMLRFETNFYVKDAQEKRGERHLAVIADFQAD
jgi:hypothetical protein